MELEAVIKNIQKMEVLCKSISQQKLAGAFRSSFKGRGVALDAIRKYEVGDDIRDINWNVTARFREPFIKTFTEDKERLIWILIDVSGSGSFGTTGKSKYELEVEIGAALAYSALESNDQVGVLFFSDKIEKLIQPARGMVHFWRIAKEMVSIDPVGKATDITGALKFLLHINPKSSVVFLLSDFISGEYGPASQVLAQQHELVAIRVFDEKEHRLPKLGWIRMKDAESGKYKWINTSSASFRKNYQFHQDKVESYFREAFRNSVVGNIAIGTHEDHMERLIGFMQSRK